LIHVNGREATGPHRKNMNAGTGCFVFAFAAATSGVPLEWAAGGQPAARPFAAHGRDDREPDSSRVVLDADGSLRALQR
jgi:hypothetical protein